MTSERSTKYQVVLFDSVYSALRSEKILKECGIEYKIIPVPRHIGSDCGVCLRFPADYGKEVEAALAGKVEISEFHDLV